MIQCAIQDVLRECADKVSLHAYYDASEGQQNYWQQIGTALINEDGSIDVHLLALPSDGRLRIQAPINDTEAGPQSE